MASRDEDHGWETVSSSMGRISATTHSDWRSARTPIDYFKRLHEEACQNDTYPIRHKLKDCDMMRSLVTSLSLTWGTKPDEGPNGSDATPFPKENAMIPFSGDWVMWTSGEIPSALIQS
jgi:hypothetical protein